MNTTNNTHLGRASLSSEKTETHSCDEHNLERHKVISITCFSREEYISLTNDLVISDTCYVVECIDIEHPIKIESLKDCFDSKLHIIYNGDRILPVAVLEEISHLGQYTNGVVYATSSPIESNEPYVLLDADDADGRYNAIHKLCMVMSNEKWVLPIDYNDIYICLFRKSGQIVILDYLLDVSGADICEVCGRITEELALRKFRSCVAHISIPEPTEVSNSIVYGWVDSLRAVLSSELSCVWGISYNDVQSRPSITLFLH